MKPTSGKPLGDLYEILETFGGGGMGLVHRARHLSWNIDVAIKHPRPEFLISRQQIDEFRGECETWASLGLDPYVSTCYYYREIEGLPCVVAEYLPGGSLQDAIQRRKIYQGDESECLARLLTIAASTAWGLSRAHQARLIHCDVKPGNMLLTEHGTAKIADFGLAVAFRPSAPDAKATWMTEQFASPEQIRGDPLTPAADVWSWAASMLAMFMGGVTWETGAACGAALADYMDQGGKAYRIPPMPPPFARILGDCLQFTPEARIADFSEIAERVCMCYEEHFDEPCPAARPDLELVSADSLNNRAVSRYDLGDLPTVHRLLDEALGSDPLHPEANFNSAGLSIMRHQKSSPVFLKRLKEATVFDLGEYRPWLYLACLLNAEGFPMQAAECRVKAAGIAAPQEMSEIERLWNLSQQGNLTPVLAPPISGEEFAYDSARFGRLMTKTDIALREQRMDDARRYLLMCGDIPGFSRHPRRRRALMQVDL